MSGQEEQRGPSRAPLLIRSAIAVAVAFGVSLYFSTDIFNILIAPYKDVAGVSGGTKALFVSPTEFFLTQMKVALFGAVFLAFPYVAMQLYKFAAPNFYGKESRTFLLYLTATSILFLMGAALAYFGALPMVAEVLQGAGAQGGQELARLSGVKEYLNLAMLMILGFGLCFQLPVVLMLRGSAGKAREHGTAPKAAGGEA